MKNIELNLSTKKIESNQRKIRTNLTREMVSDLMIHNSFDIDKFEKSILSEIRRDKIKNKINSIFENGSQR